MMDTTVKSNSETIDPADWAYEVVQSKAHAYIKLIVQTLRTLMRDRGADIEISDAELARCTSLSERTVSRYRTLAEQEGWLSCRAGRGRAKVTFYRISVPMQTLCELSDRIDSIVKNPTGSPLIAEENPTGSPTAGKKATASRTRGRTDSQNQTVGLTESPLLKKEIPPTPPKEKNNTTLHKTRAGLDELESNLIAACNGAASLAACPGLLSMAEPIKWIESGCDLELDILPTVRARAHKMRPGSVKSWSYFTQAIADAKASREAPMPKGNSKTAGERRPAGDYSYGKYVGKTI